MLDELVEEALKSGRRVRFRATGGSMRPAIREGDILLVAPARPEELAPGDIVLSRVGRKLTAHRLVEVLRAQAPEGREGGVLRVVCRGDAVSAPDLPLAPSHILGRVIAVEASTLRRRLRMIFRLFQRRISGGRASGR